MTEPSSAPEPSVPDLERILANMELRALKGDFPDERARIFNLAGDLCFDAGKRERSLSYYGRPLTSTWLPSSSTRRFRSAVKSCA